MATYQTGDLLPITEITQKPRANLLQEDAVAYPVQLTSIKWADGISPDATGAAGKPKLLLGGWGSGTGIFQGQDAQAALKTETLFFDFAIPECYVNGQTVTVSISARYNDAGSNTLSSKTLDLECYNIDQAGTAGSDINLTAIQTLTGIMTAYSFTISPAALSAGSLLRVYFQTAIQGNSGGALKAEVGGATVYLDIKG